MESMTTPNPTARDPMEAGTSSTAPARHSLKTRITLATLAIFLVSLWSLSYYASRMLRKDLEHLLGEQQFSTITMVANAIDDELRYRFETLRSVARTSAQALQEGHGALQTTLEKHRELHDLFNVGIFVTDADGVSIAFHPYSKDRIGVSYRDRDYVITALRDEQQSIGRPVMGRTAGSPVVVMAVPIRDSRGRVAGVLAGSINLALPNFLDGITGSHYGKTGGYMLVSREHRLIVTATDKTRIMEQLPAPGSYPVIDRFIDGDEGSVVTPDPHGREVLASAKRIPTAGWYAQAALPAEEAFAPIKSMQERVLLATIFATLLAAALTWWMLKRQLSPLLATATMLATLPENDTAPQPLPIARPDEIGQLIGGFNRLLKTLGERKAALRESEERFRALHDAAFNGILIHDSGIVLDCNQGLLDLTGYTRQDIIGADGFENLIAPEWRELARRNSQSGVETPYEIEGICKDGRRYPLCIRGKNFSYKHRAVRVVEFGDITERKRAEAALRDSHEVLRSILETTKDGFLRLDMNGHVIDANPAYCQLSGYTREELLGRHLSALEARESLAETTERIQRLKERDSEQFETVHRRKDGSDWHVELSSTYRRSGATGELFAFVRDISERKWAEEQLVESEARLQTLIQTLPDLIWLKDSEGVYLACNHRFEQFFGATEKDIVGKTDYDFVSRELADFFRKRDRIAMAKGVPSANEEWITFAGDGHRELLETTKTPMFDAHGHLIGVLGIGHDITERKLAEQSQRIAAIAFESQEGMFITDAAQVIIRVNGAFSRITGYAGEEAVGQTPRLLRSGRHDAAYYTEMLERIRSKGNWRGEIWNRRKNGEDYPAWLTITAVKDDAGEITHYVATMIDITARKKADEALRKLSLAVEQSPVSIVITDLAGRIEYVNPSFSLASGYSANEALGQNPRLLKSGRTPPETYANLWATLVEGKIWRGEFVNRRKDGTEYLEAATISPVRQPDGKVTHYIAVKEDITELMRTMAELRLSEERLRLAKNAAGLGIFDWDIVNGKGEWDARAREIQGVGPDEPITTATLVEGISPDDLAAIQTTIDRAIDPRGSGEYQAEARITSRIDGRMRHVAANGQVLFEAGRPVRIVGTLKDITQQRQLENEIRERRNEMESLVNQQVAAQTAAAIAHELNQPLVAVAAYSEAALRILHGGAKSPERLTRALKGAEEQAQRAGRTLHELLNFLHKGEAPTEAVELASVVRDALAIVEESDTGKFHATVEIEPGLPAVLANRLQLQKVLVNLLHNGVEAMRGAGVAETTITIKARAIADANMAQVTVQDTGPGFDAETAHRVFDSFFTTKPDGVGLGLAISRALIEAHGGKLWADSQIGHGAAFHFVLPFAA